MINRRQLLLAAASGLMLSGASAGGRREGGGLSWSQFKAEMKQLASLAAENKKDRDAVRTEGMQFLQSLDVNSEAFRVAQETSYESGNRYWLWQRLLKDSNINGGILNIDRQQMVQLHDHPGATGMVRIISGEAEVWQFNERIDHSTGEADIAGLTRVSHRMLRAGDMAVLTPEQGNIHALKSISKDCRMLDFFIPPYQRSERSWFEPLTENWFDKEQISCRKIPQHAYTKA